MVRPVEIFFASVDLHDPLRQIRSKHVQALIPTMTQPNERHNNILVLPYITSLGKEKSPFKGGHSLKIKILQRSFTGEERL
jgi:hypothetical protein